MENYKIDNLSFKYSNRENNTIENISLTVNQGEFITLCGKSGSGKTTILRLLKSSLAPFGEISGSISFEGKPLSDIDLKEQAKKIGFVMQNIDNQIVTDKVWHELAFGLESLGLKTNEIRTKVSEMSSFFGIESLFHKKTSELSGGEKQLLNLASVVVMQPSVLILDEPTSQLDPIAANNFLKTLEKLNSELGITVILSEHRLEEAFQHSDRVIVMDDGKIIADDTPKEVCKILKELNHDMQLALPAPMRVYNAVENDLECPISVREGRVWLEKYSEKHSLNPELIPVAEESTISRETAIELKNVWFKYEKNLPDVIKGLNLKINKGEFFAVVGGNGTGKTTALSLISGLNKAYRGNVYIKDEKIQNIKNLYDDILAMVPQNPQTIFIKKTVYLDLLDALENSNLTDAEKETRIKDVLSLCYIEHVINSHPYDLSGGESQRVALAKILLESPEILLLDEPTKGLDAHFKQVFANIIRKLTKRGTTVVMVSHDIEFCAQYADRCAMFFDGNITSSGTPREFFSGNSFYTTAANRMARNNIPKAVLAEDIILACGGEILKLEKKSLNKPPVNDVKKTDKTIPEKKKFSFKRIIAGSVFSLVCLISIIFFWVYKDNLFGERKYYFLSFIIMTEVIMAFLLMFEGKKPKAREIVMISVICALAVCGRTIFFNLSQFKPVVAIIIISGVCLGGETGFLVGAITAFVSNMFFGQGAWTIWQMFALGIIGYISGVFFRKGLIGKTRASLSIFGFLVTFIIYGGIMNPASVIMWQNNITKEMIKTAFVMGIPFDIVHSISTAFFLWLISVPMIEKIDRVKQKYGLIEK